MPTPLLIGLSGPSSSGKTTVARHVRSILPDVVILHEDDFYRAETELPSRAGHLDWDCAGAIDVPAFIGALSYIKQHDGALPPDLDSKEDQNAAGPNPINEETLAELRTEAKTWKTADPANARKVVIVDGFLLFGSSVPEIREMFDLRLMLRASYKDAKERRERRSGYVTLEGFWEDPKGYVDDVVWPGYVEEHAFLFQGGDVDGAVDERAAEEVDVRVVPGKGDLPMKDMLAWVLEQIKGALERER